MKEMDITNHKPRKLKCIRNYETMFNSNEGLEIGKEYTMCGIEVYGYNTDICIEEIPNRRFGSICFQEITDEE